MRYEDAKAFADAACPENVFDQPWPAPQRWSDGQRARLALSLQRESLLNNGEYIVTTAVKTLHRHAPAVL